MSADLLQTIRRLVREELGQTRTAELAVVEDIHPHASDSDTDNYACTVRLRNSGLVMKSVPVATTQIGVASIPAPGELVMVQFLGGDLNAPVVTGRLYNDEDRPPANDAERNVMHLPLAAGDAEAVHAELLSGDTRELTVRLGDGIEVVLRDDDPVIEISVDGGAGAVRIDRDGAMTLSAGSAFKLEGADITIEASGTLALKGSVVNIN